MRRPIALLILSGLTFAITLPFIVEIVIRDPLEVSFVYPSPDRPRLDLAAEVSLIILVLVTQAIAFVLAVIVGIGLLKKQRWAWYFALGLHIMVFTVHLVATLLLPPYDTNARTALMIISAPSIYLMSRKDVRSYLLPIKP